MNSMMAMPNISDFILLYNIPVTALRERKVHVDRMVPRGQAVFLEILVAQVQMVLMESVVIPVLMVLLDSLALL